MGGLGLSLGDFFRLQARAEQKNYGPIKAKAESVIHIFLPGGIAHQETFDPKPDAAEEYRGDFKTVATKVPGVFFSEHMKQLAANLDKFAMIRSIRHEQGNHGAGNHYMMTGAPPRIRFPSERYAAEYGPLATYPATFAEPADAAARAGAARRRALVDLPERW